MSGTGRMPGGAGERGSGLLVVLLVVAGLTLMGLGLLASATLSLSSTSAGEDDAERFYIAEAGLERMAGDISCSLVGRPALGRVFDNLVMLHRTHGRSRGPDGVAGTADDVGRDYVDVPHGRGRYTIDILAFPETIEEARRLEFVDLRIRSTAELAGRKQTLSGVVRVSLRPSRVFDNAYFVAGHAMMDGWPCGALVLHGNLRANGDVRLAGSCISGRGTPHYRDVVGDDLIGRIHDGGIVAGGTISGAQNCQGDFGLAGNRREHQERLAPPNLSDLSIYVRAAREWNGGTPGADGVWGTPDDTGGSTLKVWDRGLGRYRTYRACIGCNVGPDGVWNTADDLYGRDGIEGTDDDESPFMILDGRTQPVIIDGPVVIGSPGPDGVWNTADEYDASGLRPTSGAVVILGRVSGQGSIYSAGNIYIPQELVYDAPPLPHLPGPGPPAGTGYPNGPSTQPPSMAEADIEGWRKLTSTTPPAGAYRVKDADLLGLFARENIVIGRFTGGLHWDEVDARLADANNDTREDLGADRLPNTLDAGEGNGVWDVKTYSASGVNACGSGLRPAGYAPGDVIPGTGEDLDGDGRYDDRIVRGNLGPNGLPLSGASSFAFPLDINDRLDYTAPDPNGAPPLDTDGDARIWRGSPLWTDALTNHTWAEIAPDPPQFDSLDAVLYAGHAIAGVALPGPSGLHESYGAFVARVEALIGSATTIFSHDPRLLGGARGYPIHLPREIVVELRSWKAEP